MICWCTWDRYHNVYRCEYELVDGLRTSQQGTVELGSVLCIWRRTSFATSSHPFLTARFLLNAWFGGLAGIVLGLAYAQTRTLATPMLIHSLWNSGVIIVLTILRVYSWTWWRNSNAWMIGQIIAALYYLNNPELSDRTCNLPSVQITSK